MVVTLFCFLIVCLIFVVFGNIITLNFDVKNKSYSIIDNYFIGLCVVGTLLNFWSLFLPTDYTALLFLLLLTSLFLVKKRKFIIPKLLKNLRFIKSQKYFTLILCFATIILLLYATVTPRLFDTYLYHINAIQWNENFRAVPGLANFHHRLGFNSSSLVLGAAFSFNDLFNQYIFVINSCSMLLFFFWILKTIYFKRNYEVLFSILFIYYFFKQYALDISSPSTDLITNIIVGYLFLTLLFDSKAIQSKSMLFIIVPIFSLTLKLSILPIVLISIYCIYLKKENLFQTLKVFSMYSFIFLIPWLVRNVILTGYIIFPFERLDLFNFDWEVSKSYITEVDKSVKSWARIPERNFDEVLSMPLSQWFEIWFNKKELSNKVFFILAVFTPLTSILFFITNKKNRTTSLLLLSTVAYLIFIFWFFTAPDFRFSFSIILFLAILPLYFLKDIFSFSKKITNPIAITVCVYCFMMIAYNGFVLFTEDYRKIKTVIKYAYLPKDVYYEKFKRNIVFNKKTYYSPNKVGINLYEPALHFQNFDQFPSTLYLDESFKLRGDHLQDGFLTNKKTFFW